MQYGELMRTALPRAGQLANTIGRGLKMSQQYAKKTSPARPRTQTARPRKPAPRRRGGLTPGLIALICAAVLVLGLTIAAIVVVRQHMDEPQQMVAAVLPTYLPRDTVAPTHAALGNGTAVVDSEHWMLLLVNSKHQLESSYAPSNFTELSNHEKIDKRIYSSLQEMFDAARNQGINPSVGTGYRTPDQLAELRKSRMAEYALHGDDADTAAYKVMDVTPGASEHQTGLAFDVKANPKGTNTDQQVFDWMAANCYKYGFIVRYPEGKESITGVPYNAAHLRYVGEDAARQIMNQRITLEEYLGIYN